MKLTKGIITRAEALKISADYVAWVEGDHNKFDVVEIAFNKMKRGQKAITFEDGYFVEVKVTSVNHNDYRAIDGPLVRLGNGEYTWRVDGSNLAFPIKKVNVIELKGNNYESVLSRINDMDIRFFRNDFRTF